MVFVDTDMLSIFGKVQRLPLLFAVFETDVLHIAAAVEKEVKSGVSKGFPFSRDIMALQAQGSIQTHSPNAADQGVMSILPNSLKAGESESMALCQRLNATFASNERRVMHHCQAHGIRCLNLEDMLRMLWEFEVLTQSDVRHLMNEIETADRLHFRAPNEVFQ